MIECITYRMEGHSEADQAAYRQSAEVEEWRQKDPILRLRKHMLETGFSEEDLPQPAQEVVDEVRDAIDWASTMPMPEGKEAVEDIYDEAAEVTHWSTPYPNYVRVPWLER